MNQLQEAGPQGQAQAGGSSRSAKGKMFQMLLQLYLSQPHNSIQNIKMSSVLAVLQDEGLMKDIIPRQDPYYVQMMSQLKESQERIRAGKRGGKSEDGDLMTGHLFNHPLLQFYHNERAQTKKEQMDINDHKMKTFKIHRWDILKHIKKLLEQQFAQLYHRRQKARMLLVLALVDAGLRRLAARYRRRRQKAAETARSRFISLLLGQAFCRRQRKKAANLKLRQQSCLRQ